MAQPRRLCAVTVLARSGPTLCVVRGYIRRMRLVLISGIPATGKTCFGNWLAREHGFLHIDLETSPLLQDVMPMEPLAFIGKARAGRSDMVITWGFPPLPQYLAKVRDLHVAGLVAWWFDGDREAAFESFKDRPGHPGTESNWHVQLELIGAFWPQIADLYGERRMDVIGPGPSYMDRKEIFSRMFP
jgi:hypothetical protein